MENHIAIIDLASPDDENDQLRNLLFLRALKRQVDGLMMGNYVEQTMKLSVDNAQKNEGYRSRYWSQ